MKNTHFGHFTAGRVKEGVFLEEFTHLASHSAVCAVLCCAALFCAVLCATFMLEIRTIFVELLRRPKVIIVILKDF